MFFISWKQQKQTGDVSMNMFIILIAGLPMWERYSILNKDLPIIFTNAFSFFVNMLNIIFSLKFKKQKGK